MKFFSTAICLLFVFQLSFGQTKTNDIFDVYMAFPKDQIKGLICQDDTPTNRRKLIDYKPSESIIVLESACEAKSVTMSLFGKNKDFVLVIENWGLDNSQDEISFYSARNYLPISWPVPACPEVSESIKNNPSFAEGFKAFTDQNPSEAKIKWGIDKQLNLIAYVNHESKNAQFVLGTWTFDGREFRPVRY